MRDLEKLKLDPEDEYLLRLRIFISKGYPMVYINGKNDAIHRVIMGKKPGYEVDHINRDKLDNRRSNLRFVTHQQNLSNRNGWGKLPKGVYLDPGRGRIKKYKAMRRINGKTVSFGYHLTVEDAVEALNKKEPYAQKALF